MLAKLSPIKIISLKKFHVGSHNLIEERFEDLSKG